MFLISVLSIICFQDFIDEPIPVAEAATGHDQTDICSAMAPDGRFAVAWIEQGPTSESDVYLRFFDIDGQAATSPIKIEKLDDSINPSFPCLGMESTGNTVLAWEEAGGIRFQQFTRNGISKEPAQTIVLTNLQSSTLDLSVNAKGNFVIAWSEQISYDSSRIRLSRYSPDGSSVGEAFTAHDGLIANQFSHRLAVALNEEEGIVVAWPGLRIQVFDSLNQRILTEYPSGKMLFEDAGSTDPRLHWLDDQRFVLFATNPDFWYMSNRIIGTGFTEKGDYQRASIVLVPDTLIPYSSFFPDIFSSAVFGDRFALNYGRDYGVGIEDTGKVWRHQAAVVGNIVYTTPYTSQEPFEYTPPLGADTVSEHGDLLSRRTTVSANENNLVWGYSRFEADSIRKAYVTISDWNITGVEEPPVKECEAVFSIGSSIGSEVVLRYENFPEGFHASVFDATGRRVDVLTASGTSGELNWGRDCRPGVYFFIKVERGGPRMPQKVVLIR